jgi:hypothetical protein
VRYLGCPAAMVARELVDEEKRETLPVLFVIELDAVGGFGLHVPRGLEAR